MDIHELQATPAAHGKGVKDWRHGHTVAPCSAGCGVPGVGGRRGDVAGQVQGISDRRRYISSSSSSADGASSR